MELNGAKTAEQLTVYDVPYNKLHYYKNGIYKLDADYNEEIKAMPKHLSRVMHGVFEQNNIQLQKTLIRMYYLAANDENMPSRAFKESLLKSAIDKFTNERDEPYRQFIENLSPFLKWDY